MGRTRWKANLDGLCRQFEVYVGAHLPGHACQPSAAATGLGNSLYLAHSTSDRNFSDICRAGRLTSAATLAAGRGGRLSPTCAEVVMGTADSVFFYVAPFRFPNTDCGVLFAHTLESDYSSNAAASPFDSGGLMRRFTRPNPAESPREFLSRHELPVPGHRRYLALSMSHLFHKPQDYVEGTEPHLPGPIGLSGGDQRRWTHEVRVPDQVFLRGAHLQAVFAPKARVAGDPDIESLFQWCAAEGVDRVLFDAPHGDDFEELRRECPAYIRRKLY